MAGFDNNLDELEALLMDLDGRPQSVAPPRGRQSTKSTTLDFNEIDDIINVLGSDTPQQRNSYHQPAPVSRPAPQQQHQQQYHNPHAVPQQHYGGAANNLNNTSSSNNNPRNTLDNIDDLLRGLEGGRGSVRASVAPQGSYKPAGLNAHAHHNAQPRPVTTKMAPASSQSKVFVASPPTVRPVQGDSLDQLLNSITSSASVPHNVPAAKGGCASCGRPILGESITALGKTYHPEHFLCGNCNRPLGTSSFFEQDGVPNCERCYTELLCARCAHCEEPITDKCITALGKKWHVNHFICSHCLNPFPNGTYFERDSRPYCDGCFSGNFNPRCAGCNQPIKGEITNALGQQWHPEHFVCQYCQKAFTGTFYEYAGKPYCDVHYHQQTGSLCAGCGKAVTGKCINALDKRWHPEHFVCGFCMNPLQGGNFTENAGKAYCRDCHGKLFG